MASLKFCLPTVCKERKGRDLCVLPLSVIYLVKVKQSCSFAGGLNIKCSGGEAVCLWAGLYVRVLGACSAAAEMRLSRV